MKIRIWKRIELDRLGPGLWRLAWERHGTDGTVEIVVLAGATYSIAKVVPVLLGLGKAATTAEAAERVRQLAREQGWPEPDIHVFDRPEEQQ